MFSLSLNLAIIFGVQIVVGNAVKYCIPYAQYRYVMFTHQKAHGVNFSEPEVDFLLNRYDQIGAGIRNYTAVAIQFGYMSLFITALPIAGVFGLLCNTLNLRSVCTYLPQCCFCMPNSHQPNSRFEIWSLLTIYQRPFPKAKAPENYYSIHKE